MYKIPRDPAWCSYCISHENGQGQPCRDHVDGKEYSGSEAYDPSDFVLETVGKRFRSFDRSYLCFGYDPRHGFWVRDEETGEQRNISERAIGRTYHRIWERVSPS
jgi:hypothetical protein